MVEEKPQHPRSLGYFNEDKHLESIDYYWTDSQKRTYRIAVTISFLLGIGGGFSLSQLVRIVL